jgi:hypothetical protein
VQIAQHPGPTSTNGGFIVDVTVNNTVNNTTTTTYGDPTNGITALTIPGSNDTINIVSDLSIGLALHGARHHGAGLRACHRAVHKTDRGGTGSSAYRGEVLCLRIQSISEATQLRPAAHGVGFQCLPECTGASPVRQNDPASRSMTKTLLRKQLYRKVFRTTLTVLDPLPD